MSYKHVGRIKNNQRKIIVAYRTVPGEPENCIVITTENLMADEHDALIKLVESDTGQSSNEFAEAMARAQLPDGRNMLSGFHTTGKMVKVPTTSVEMTPDRNSVIGLDELNKIIAQQKGIGVDDLSNTPSEDDKPDSVVMGNSVVNTITEDAKILTDEELASKMRADATQLSREAKRLREEAEKLHPNKKRSQTRAKKSANKEPEHTETSSSNE